MRRGVSPAPVPHRDRSWLVGLAVLALTGGGVASQAAGAPHQGQHGPKGSTTTTTIVCAPATDASSTTTTTTTTTVTDSTTPVVCPPESTTTTTPGTDPGGSSTTPGGPDTTQAEPGAGSSVPVDPASTAIETTTPPSPPTTEVDVALPELPVTPPEDWPVRLISFPVAGPITYYDDWGACRGGPDCPRRHIGNDLIGRRLQPLLAATDGVVSHLVLDHPTAGWGLVITDAEGWDYRYYHVNNDAPGTDDGSDPPAWRLAAGIGEGVAVKAGQVVAYLGDSGNSELSVPHLHFEIHRPDGSPIDPYLSLRFSEWSARCSVAAPGVAPGIATESAMMPPVNEAMADASVVTSTGRGKFLLSLDGTVLAQGDADSVGWGRHALEDPPCPPPAPAPSPAP